MPHVHLLAAWQNNDIEKIASYISEDIHVTLTTNDQTQEIQNHDEFINCIQSYLQKIKSENKNWQFDVLYKTERQSSNVVVIKIAADDEEDQQSKEAALAIFTFSTVGEYRKLVRAYIEAGVANR